MSTSYDMYEYGHEQVILRQKRWNNKEIFIVIIFVLSVNSLNISGICPSLNALFKYYYYSIILLPKNIVNQTTRV